MPQVEIKIGSRGYKVACGAGEEPHLQKAAKLLDAEATRLAESGQVLPENTVLLMSGLMLADQILSKSGGGSGDASDAAPRIAALEAEVTAAKAATEKAEAAAKAATKKAEAAAKKAGAGEGAGAEELATLTEERDAARMEVQSLKEALAGAKAPGPNGDNAVLERMAVELERLADEIEAGAIRAKAS